MDFVRILVLVSCIFICSTDCCPSPECLCTGYLIDCAGLSLSDIPKFDCSKLVGFKYLSLIDNQIVCPNATVLQDLFMCLKNIDIRKNPLQCSCLSPSLSNIRTDCSGLNPSSLTPPLTTSKPSGVITSSISTIPVSRNQARSTPSILQSLVTSLESTSAIIQPTSSYIPTSTSTLVVHPSPARTPSRATSTRVFVIQTTTFYSPTLKQNFIGTGENKNLQWVLETSISVPLGVLVIGIGLLLYKIERKHYFSRPHTCAMEMNEYGFTV